MPNTKEYIALLEEISDLMEFHGENRFKISAFRNGARNLRSDNIDVEDAIETKEIENIKGVGKGIRSVIMEFYETGESQTLINLKDTIPDRLLEVFTLRGLGPKKIALLYKELGIRSLEDLEEACKENKIAALKGFGNATQAKIMSSIEKRMESKSFVLLSKAVEMEKEILEKLASISCVKKINNTGELRRIREVISSLEFVLLPENNEKCIDALKKLFNGEDSSENQVLTIKGKYPIPLVFHLVENEAEFHKQLFHTTGAREFLDEVSPNGGDGWEHGEEAFFKNINAPYVSPEMREKEFFELNDDLKSPSNLTMDNIHGFLHFHTKHSDGVNTLKEMVTHARDEYGFSYFAVCDHSQTPVYANGLSEERILKQNNELKGLVSELNTPIFQGIESDILMDGDLDYSDEFMSTFEFVVASIHSGFSISEEKMTERIIKAIENPHTDVIGHLTGRLLLSRAPYKLNQEKILDACSQNDVAIEINANPQRLDLDWRMMYYARNKGCKFAINADAHSTKDISYTKFGIMVAKKAGIRKEEVINFYDLKEFKTFLNRKIKRV